MNIGEKIKTFRKDSGQSQRQLAEKAGWCEDEKKGENRLSNYETGIRQPAVNDLYDIASALDIHIADFFPRSEEAQEQSLNAKQQVAELDVKNFSDSDYELALEIIKIIKKSRK